MPGSSKRQIRFADFEVDLVAGELRKNGRPARLQDQPFRILRCMLERPGEIVTREELRKEIWGDDVYVDFDRSLNTSVARLREALGDSPTRPAYVETVPRKGYRFIARVEAEGSQPHEGQTDETGSRPSGPGGRRLALLATAAVIAAVCATLYWPSPAGEESPERVVQERLTSYPGAEYEASFSPDGSQFAFIWNGESRDNFDIYVRTVSPGPARRLTHHPGIDHSPAWSPDGQWIAFQRHRDDGLPLLLRVSPLGGREERLLELPGDRNFLYGRGVTWAPDSRHLLITVFDKPPASYSVRLFDIETGSTRELVRPGFQPSLSPDGSRLAFSTFYDGCFVQPLSGSLEPAGAPQRLEYGDGCYTPVWTTDGKRLVASLQFGDSQSGELWLINPSAEESRSLHVFGGSSPAIAANGRLAYEQSTSTSSIHRLDIETGQSLPLIVSSAVNMDPSYSPSGDKISFRSHRGPVGTWVANADGSNPHLLVEGGYDARWSPDGSQVLFRAVEPGNTANDGRQDVWIVDAAGGPAKNLTKSPSRDVAPRWLEGGDWIYFNSDRGGKHGLWRMRPDGSEPSLVLEGRFSELTQTPDGKHRFAQMGRAVYRSRSGSAFKILVDGISGWASYAVAEDGLYYATLGHSQGSEIRFIRFSDESDILVHRIGGLAGWGMDLSPDGRYLLFTVLDRQSDLMLLEGAF